MSLGVKLGLVIELATEVLNVPEENLRDVIKVLRAGLKKVKVSRDTKEALTRWCDEEEEYLDRQEED